MSSKIFAKYLITVTFVILRSPYQSSERLFGG